MSAKSSDPRRAIQRVHDMLENIANIRDLPQDRTATVLAREKIVRAAFERYLEIISEASRHVPTEWKAEFGPAIGWRAVADLGNHIRHGYEMLNYDTLWNIYENDLDHLQLALQAMIARHGQP